MTRIGIPNIRVFGPSKAAATLEGSKTFAKDFMVKYGIPTARYRNFKDYNEASRYIENAKHDVVIKATGLAGGKGVILPSSKAEAQTALRDMMLNKEFGSAGDEVVIEEFLQGDELSFLTFSDGYTIKSLPAAQDHKQIYNNDKGPNTGGMGAYAPAPIATSALVEEIQRTVLQPTVDAMRKHEGHPFVGLLFTGLMFTKEGPKVLEYNVRFGDPETQTLLPLISMDTDLAEVMIACTEGRLDGVDLRIKSGSSATVVAAAAGYPGSYGKGDTIHINETCLTGDSDHIFHAGTTLSSGTLETAGGRVIAATSTADTLEKALAQAYKTMASINWPGKHTRSDIGHRALARPSHFANGNGMTYASAGVSITSGNELIDRIKPLVKSTARPGASAELGGFGGAFDAYEAGYKETPILITGTDGVGTKLKIAQATSKHDTIGVDLVAMNVNDLVVQGAEPLFFTDVYSCSRLDVDVATNVVKGICDGCREAGCALIGGETAEMSGLFASLDEYDVVGTTTGAIGRGRKILPDKESMQEGDIVLGLASSGCHSNGFSLIRKIVEKSGLTYSDKAPWCPTTTVGESLLVPTRIYVKSLLKAVDKDLIKGMAHITGGGLIENIPRMLPKHLAATMDANAWKCPDVLRWLKKAGGVADEEFARVFNTGLGMVLVVAARHEMKVIEVLREAGETVYIAGSLGKRDTQGCIVRNMQVWNQ